MRLVVDQLIGVPVDRAQNALLDPGLYSRLGRGSPVTAIEVLADERTDRLVTQRVRLRFTGRLNRTASRFVDLDKLTWVQETTTDLAERRTTIGTVPDRYGRLLTFDGWYRLREAGETRTLQHLECDLRVSVPGLGRLAEQGIARGLREHLANQAALIESGPPPIDFASP